jgi:hypothetical protein
MSVLKWPSRRLIDLSQAHRCPDRQNHETRKRIGSHHKYVGGVITQKVLDDLWDLTTRPGPNGDLR